MKIGKYNFGNNPIVMGILNMTPDSFSDGGKYNTIDSALCQVEKMIREGASIIDVGGESTRPGYTMISVDEEIQRVAPVIEAINNRFDVPISLDTYKHQVAEAGIKAGCNMINDIWGLKWNEKFAENIAEYDSVKNVAEQNPMAKLVADTGVSICLMHNRDNTQYVDFVEEVICDLKESVDIALNNGIKSEQIIVDPGVGFGKTYEQNLSIIKNVDKLQQLGYPILLGTSRKSVIGIALDAEKDDRIIGTVATTVMGLERGCQIFRVHDVKENHQALKFTNVCLRQEI